MFSCFVKIPNKTGLHARPASRLVAFCQNFENKICIRVGEKEFDPKSMISILSAGIKQGQEVELIVHGPDEEKAGQEIIAFIELLSG